MSFKGTSFYKETPYSKSLTNLASVSYTPTTVASFINTTNIIKNSVVENLISITQNTTTQASTQSGYQETFVTGNLNVKNYIVLGSFLFTNELGAVQYPSLPEDATFNIIGSIGSRSLVLNAVYNSTIPDDPTSLDQFVELYNSKVMISGPICKLRSQEVDVEANTLRVGYYDRYDLQNTKSYKHPLGDKGIIFEYLSSSLIDGFMGYSVGSDRFCFFSNITTDTNTGVISKNVPTKIESFNLDKIYTNMITSADTLGDNTLTISSVDKLTISSAKDTIMNGINLIPTFTGSFNCTFGSSSVFNVSGNLQISSNNINVSNSGTILSTSLGSNLQPFRNLYVNNLNSNVNCNGSILDSVIIGKNTPLAGYFTDIYTQNIKSNINCNGYTLDNVVIGKNTPGASFFTNLSVQNLVSNVNCNGYTLDNVVIGKNTPGASFFTNLSVQNLVSNVNCEGNILDNVVIGSTTPLIGNFTTINANKVVASLDFNYLQSSSDSTRTAYGPLGNRSAAFNLDLGSSSRTDAILNIYGKISNLQSPVVNTDATNKSYVDSAILASLNSYLSLSGGTMTGSINMGGTYGITNLATPINSTDASTKGYIDSNYLPLLGSTMIGPINMGTYGITNLATPINSTDASTKGYVDSNYFPLLGGTVSGRSDFTNTAYFHGSDTITLANYQQYDETGPSSQLTGSPLVGISCDNSVIGSQFLATSSKEQKIIVENDENQVFHEIAKIIKDLSFYKYVHKDSRKFGNGVFYGVIAEQVKDILPSYILDKSEFIPNIYKNGKVGDITGLDTFIISMYLNEDILRSYSLKKLALSHINNRTFVVDILEITYSTNGRSSIRVKSNDETIRKLSVGDNIFVYGSYEKSAVVSKERLGELSLVCVKHLCKRIEELEKLIKVTN